MSAKRILLVGGGHAHVGVLADWIQRGIPAPATLLTPHPYLRYSGTVPGWIAGEYARDDGLVDLAGLAKRAGADLILGRCLRIDPDKRVVSTQSHGEAVFDIASIDTGGVGRAQSVLGDAQNILDIRPIDRFVERLDAWSVTPDRALNIAVIGGGAGGVELAFALRNTARFGPRPDVTLIAGEAGLLASLSSAVREKVRNELTAQAINLVEADAAWEEDGLRVGARSLPRFDIIIAALGSAAPAWPAASGLACDDNGFIAVDRHQRSVSHPHIFAAGDVAARSDTHVPHSGVHAVHTGPVLAANLRAAIEGQPVTKSYTPRPASLYLIATGNGGAILSYGSLAMQGQWAGRLKRWIDKRWLSQYAQMAGAS